MIEFVEWSVVAVFEPSEMFQVCNSQQWHNLKFQAQDIIAR